MATINTQKLQETLKTRYGTEAKWDDTLGGWHAEIETGRGNLGLVFIEKGARVWKPNGTRKTYYEVSNAQLVHYLDQALEFWRS